MATTNPTSPEYTDDMRVQGEQNGNISKQRNSENSPFFNDNDGITERNLESIIGDDDVFVEYKYGWCSWQPDWIQTLNRPQWLLVFLCLYTFIQGLIVNGFVNVVISTLERRFDLPSTKTGLIASTYDIATAVLVVFVGYYGGRGHKARWVSFGCVIMAVGSIVFALPHFTTGPHKNNFGSLDLLCVENSSNECEGAKSSRLSNYLYVFILSQVLHGIGCTPLYCIGVTLIDESVTVHQSALYLGIFFTISTLGPATGYMAGGSLLNIYTDIGQVDINSLDMTPNDPGWVGAWWIGFLAGGILAFFVAVPIGGYPRELPSTAKIRAKKISQAHASSNRQDVLSPSFGNKLSDFPRAMKYLFMNPTFVFLVLVGCAEGIIVSGFSTFGPKVIETQFGKTAGQASLLMGMCTVPGAGFGTFLGGYLVKRWKLKVRGMIKFCCCTIFVALLALFGMLLRCPQEHLVGVNTDYYGNITVPDRILENDCNVGCGCTRNEFNPVCGDNGLEYYSPCFAGCTGSSEGAKVILVLQAKLYHSGCTCLTLSGNHTDMTATAGKCATNCSYLPFVLICLVTLMVFHFMATVPGFTTLLRCVPDSQRSLAVGVNWIFLRLLGTIPGPIAFGAALDSSCLLWQEDCRGERGSCFLYSAKDISWKLFLLGIGFKLLSLIFFIMALWSYRSPEDGNVKHKDDKDGNCVKETNKRVKDDRYFSGNKTRQLMSQSSQIGMIANEDLPEYELNEDNKLHEEISGL